MLAVTGLPLFPPGGLGQNGLSNWAHNPHIAAGRLIRTGHGKSVWGNARGDSLARRQAGARQQIARQGGKLTSKPAAGGEVSESYGEIQLAGLRAGGPGSANRAGGAGIGAGGADRIGGRDLSRGGAGRPKRLWRWFPGIQWPGARSNSNRGSSSWGSGGGGVNRGGGGFGGGGVSRGGGGRRGGGGGRRRGGGGRRR